MDTLVSTSNKMATDFIIILPVYLLISIYCDYFILL